MDKPIDLNTMLNECEIMKSEFELLNSINVKKEHIKTESDIVKEKEHIKTELRYSCKDE